jgi:hypothetical protein
MNNIEEAKLKRMISMALSDIVVDKSFKNHLRSRLLAGTKQEECEKAKPFFRRGELWFALATVFALGVIGYGLWLPSVMSFG